VAVVERVHEVETNVTRNQFEAGLTASGDFPDVQGLGQRSFPFPPII
jgi:hypothetical protein